MTMQFKHVDCAGYCLEHVIRFFYDPDDEGDVVGGYLHHFPMLSIDVGVVPFPWYKRIWFALKYIFRRNEFAFCESAEISYEGAEKIVGICNEFMKRAEETNPSYVKTIKKDEWVVQAPKKP